MNLRERVREAILPWSEHGLDADDLTYAVMQVFDENETAWRVRADIDREKIAELKQQLETTQIELRVFDHVLVERDELKEQLARCYNEFAEVQQERNYLDKRVDQLQSQLSSCRGMLERWSAIGFPAWWSREWGQFGENFSEYSKSDMRDAYHAGMEAAAVIAEGCTKESVKIAKAIRASINSTDSDE